MERRPRKIKILFTIPNFDTAGSGKALLNIASRLNKKYFEPHLACLHDKGDYFKVVKESAIPIHIFNFTAPMEQRIKGLIKCWNTSRQLQTINPDIIHSFHYSPDYSEPLASRLAGVPWIFTKKNMSWGGKSKNAWKLRSALAKHIIIQNIDMKEEFYSSSTKITLIPRGVDIKDFSLRSKNKILLNKYFISSDDKIILTVANLVPVKGIEVLIEAFEQLYHEQTNIHLFIVGDNDNDYGRKLGNKVNNSKLQKQIYFTGKKQNVIDYYSIADIFVLPTLNEGRREGCPVALLEAMACELPILASNISGVMDILKDFPECLFEAGNTLDLKNSLKKLLFSFNEKTKKTRAIYRNSIINNFDIKHEVNLHENLYHTLVN